MTNEQMVTVFEQVALKFVGLKADHIAIEQALAILRKLVAKEAQGDTSGKSQDSNLPQA